MKVLLPTDGSKEALAALRYALSFTRNFVTPSSFDLLTVYDTINPSLLMGDPGVDGIDEILEKQGHEDQAQSIQLLRNAGVTYQARIVQGPVVKTILDHINKTEPDLVIMGVKGRGVIGDLLMGSIARAVSTASNKPVLLIDPKKLPQSMDAKNPA